MDHLSSCYFCGAALDEPLRAYTVESSEGRQSVTLCASCRHKLDRLLDATGTGATVPVEPGSESPVGERGEDSEPRTDEGSTDPGIGEKEPEELLESGTEKDADPPPENEASDAPAEPEEGADAETADASEQTVGEWDPDPEEWGEPADSATPVDLDPEPITTNPEELPDDEEIREVPGLAVDDDSASGGWETDIQDEMQPDVPEAFADTDEVEADPDEPEEPTAADDSDANQPGEESEAESATASDPQRETVDIDEPPEASPEADGETTPETEAETTPEDDTEPFDSDELGDIESTVSEPIDDTDRESVGGDDPLASELEESSGSDEPTEPSDPDEEPAAGEGGIDPTILQADEIATGEADIEEVLDGEIEVPDELANELEQQSEADNDQPTTEPETNGEEAIDPEAMDTEDPFDLDAGSDESETGESMDPETAEFDEPAAEEGELENDSGDGGFDFDNEPGPPPEEEKEELQSEMEADIPEELCTGSGTESEDPTDDLEDDLEAIDAMSTGAITEDDDTTDDAAEAEPSDEEIAFGDEQDGDTASEESTPVTEAETDDRASVDSGEEESGADEPAPPDSGESGGSDDEDQRRSISALEYNKVMRLLQNREFPVDRMELMAVAASTYDLTEADCAEVLDIAIDRGLLAEDGNKLIKPD